MRTHRDWVPRGPANHAWKGDAAHPNTKRARARRMYPLAPCEKCSEPGTDRHHKDGDTGNNVRSNVEILCRRCHMLADGRLAKFYAHSLSLRGPQPSKPCSNCTRPSKPLRGGRCHSCNEYLRRNGTERPYVDDGRKEGARKGAGCASAKLTEDQVFLIRRRYEEGASQTQLAADLGVTNKCIWAIVHRKVWTHLPDARATRMNRKAISMLPGVR